MAAAAHTVSSMDCLAATAQHSAEQAETVATAQQVLSLPSRCAYGAPDVSSISTDDARHCRTPDAAAQSAVAQI
jgi:hypothetical protein